jgi:chorismate mutase
MVEANGVDVADIACAIMTTTPDLNAEFPAAAARELGWSHIALLCAQEVDVSGSPSRCLRILIMWNTQRAAEEVIHVYLKGAKGLRPDLVR